MERAQACIFPLISMLNGKSCIRQLVSGIVICTGLVSAQDRPAERAETAGHLFNPAKANWSPETLSRLRVPAGFRINVFAARMGNTRMMAVSPSGGVYVTRRNTEDVIFLRDTDGVCISG